MNGIDVGIIAAFFAGLVSVLSPCVSPLLPGYLAVITGESRQKPIIQAALFVLSFSFIFVLLGVGAHWLGGALIEQRALLEDIAATIMILMGIFFVLGALGTRLSRGFHSEKLQAAARTGGPLAVGAAFAISWTPCIGPTLGAVLSAAALGDSTTQAAWLLSWYSMGLAVPFLLMALFYQRTLRALDFFRRHQRWIVGFGGLLLITMGILVATGELYQINIWAQGVLDDLGINFFRSV